MASLVMIESKPGMIDHSWKWTWHDWSAIESNKVGLSINWYQLDSNGHLMAFDRKQQNCFLKVKGCWFDWCRYMTEGPQRSVFGAAAPDIHRLPPSGILEIIDGTAAALDSSQSATVDLCCCRGTWSHPWWPLVDACHPWEQSLLTIGWVRWMQGLEEPT